MAEAWVPRLVKPSLVAPTADSTPGLRVASARTLRPLTGSCCTARVSTVLPIWASTVSSDGGVDSTVTLVATLPTSSFRLAVTWAAASTTRLRSVEVAKPCISTVTV